MRFGAIWCTRPLTFACAAMLLAGCSATPRPPAGRIVANARPAAGAHIGPCSVFPADNIWNTRIDKLPRNVHSDAYLDSIGITERLHADFGSKLLVGIPITIANPDAPPAQIKFQYADESDQVGYPLERGAAIEGGYHSTGDRHVVLVDLKNCSLFELWHVSAQPGGGWTAGSGMRMDLRSNALRRNGITSADAAGLPILPGLVRYDEVMAGEIRHALRFTVVRTQHAYVWPSTSPGFAGPQSGPAAAGRSGCGCAPTSTSRVFPASTVSS